MDVVQASDHGGSDYIPHLALKCPGVLPELRGQTDKWTGERTEVLLHACDEESLSHSLF